MREKSIILPPYKTWEERVREKRAAITEPFGQPALNVKTQVVEQLSPLKVDVRRYSKIPRGPWVGYRLEPEAEKEGYDSNKINIILKNRQDISYRTGKAVETPLYDAERKTKLYAFRGSLLPEKEAMHSERELLEIQKKAETIPQLVLDYGATEEQLLADKGWKEKEIREYREKRGREYRPPEFKVPGTEFKPHGLPKGKIEVPKEKLEYLEPEAEMLEKLVPGSYMALQKAQLNYKNNPGPATKKSLESLWNSISINAADKAKKDPSVAKIMATG